MLSALVAATHCPFKALWLSIQKSCGARLGGLSDAWCRWWSDCWPSASELSAWCTNQDNARGARPDTGVKRAYRMGGHIIFGQGIAGPPQIANFLRVQFEGKKIATSPKKGGAKFGSIALTLCK